MTYGELKLRLTQMFPGVSLDLLEGWVNDRYAEVLGELPWQRQNFTLTLATAAPYVTGTAAVANGSRNVTLTGGTWTSGMTGSAFRATGRQEYYEFTFLTGTSGQLDRPYEGATSAAAGYSIFRLTYAMPSDCRILENNAFSPLKRFSHAELSQIDPNRVAMGEPVAWASYMDDSSVPPLMQVELYPIPNTAKGLLFTYGGDAGNLAAQATIIQAWMQPTALVEGIIGRVKRHLKDYVGAAAAEIAAKVALGNMRTSEAQGMAPAEMRLDSYYTRHRLRRTCR